jgi:crotonobetainyl-CoA:carnitine CoA-transferase CaiB-like acyl-CoA transferase
MSCCDELFPILQEIFLQKSQQEWCESLPNVGVIVGRVRDYHQLEGGPDRDRAIFVDVLHPTHGSYRTVGPFYQLPATPPAVRSAPPFLGEHTAELLTSLGYDQPSIDRLRRDRVIGPA